MFFIEAGLKHCDLLFFSIYVLVHPINIHNIRKTFQYNGLRAGRQYMLTTKLRRASQITQERMKLNYRTGHEKRKTQERTCVLRSQQ